MSEQFLLLDAQERRDAYAAAGARFGLPPAVIEKDVWICWVLDVLYREPEPDRHPMAFKGGTSLSKVFDAIFRFSEDVDLTIGVSPASFADGEIPTSRNQRDKLRAEVERELDSFLASHVVPLLTHALGPAAGDSGHSVDQEGSDVVWVEYPSCYEGEIGYIRERVKLEYGARNRIEPNERHTIRPYVAEVLGADFVLPTAEVDVLSPKRTFWEKATLAHDMCNRGQWDRGAHRLSRHWYDLAMLADHPIGSAALTDRALLADVVRVKEAFYRRGTSDYDACLSGRLRLLPEQDGVEALAADYAQMIDAGMFSRPPPAIEVLLDRLDQLQAEINAGTSQQHVDHIH